mmetsp:Transcript_53953/g.141490  ORF Transcript_53953/g.141490 Transcript_53953/m.141490 type:complete len:262 (-) Transcript_53953:9-794(-)
MQGLEGLAMHRLLELLQLLQLVLRNFPIRACHQRLIQGTEGLAMHIALKLCQLLFVLGDFVPDSVDERLVQAVEGLAVPLLLDGHELLLTILDGVAIDVSHERRIQLPECPAMPLRLECLELSLIGRGLSFEMLLEDLTEDLLQGPAVQTLLQASKQLRLRLRRRHVDRQGAPDLGVIFEVEELGEGLSDVVRLTCDQAGPEVVIVEQLGVHRHDCEVVLHVAVSNDIAHSALQERADHRHGCDDSMWDFGGTEWLEPPNS